jgi:hypothetical protein
MREKSFGIRALSRFAICSLCILAATAHGTTKDYQIVPSSNDCAYAVDTLKDALQVIDYPAGYKFLIACDDSTWQTLQQKVPILRLTHHAGTDRLDHVVILRGEMFRRNIDNVHYLRVLRHEALHAILDTDDEAVVVQATSKEENGKRYIP